MVVIFKYHSQRTLLYKYCPLEGKKTTKHLDSQTFDETTQNTTNTPHLQMFLRASKLICILF